MVVQFIFVSYTVGIVGSDIAINLLRLLYLSCISIFAKVVILLYHCTYFLWRLPFAILCKQHNVGALVTDFNEGKSVSTNMLAVSLGGMLGGCLLFVTATNFFADRTCLSLISFFYKMKFIFIKVCNFQFHICLYPGWFRFYIQNVRYLATFAF